MKTIIKNAKLIFKKSDIVRYLLIGFLLYKIYFETGPYTTAGLICLFFCTETLCLTNRLKSKRDKSLIVILDDLIEQAKRARES